MINCFSLYPCVLSRRRSPLKTLIYELNASLRISFLAFFSLVDPVFKPDANHDANVRLCTMPSRRCLSGVRALDNLRNSLLFFNPSRYSLASTSLSVSGGVQIFLDILPFSGCECPRIPTNYAILASSRVQNER